MKHILLLLCACALLASCTKPQPMWLCTIYSATTPNGVVGPKTVTGYYGPMSYAGMIAFEIRGTQTVYGPNGDTTVMITHCGGHQPN